MPGDDDYDIFPRVVAQVLDQVGTDGNTLVKRYEDLEDPLHGAGVATGGSALIAGALTEVVGWVQDTLAVARNHVQKCVDGAANATNAYVAGDEEMAREYGTTAVLGGPVPGVFPGGPENTPADNGPRDTPAQRRAGRGGR